VQLDWIMRNRALAACATVASAALCLRLGASVNGVMCLAPALALALLLHCRRYPGARRLVAFSARATRRRPRTACSAVTPARPTVRIPRGGLLIACALAVRPPPVASLTS